MFPVQIQGAAGKDSFANWFTRGGQIVNTYSLRNVSEGFWGTVRESLFLAGAPGPRNAEMLRFQWFCNVSGTQQGGLFSWPL